MASPAIDKPDPRSAAGTATLASTGGPTARPAAGQDRLTIFRLLVITAGIAIGLVVYSPPPERNASRDISYYRELSGASLIGACLPAGFFAWGWRRRNKAQLGPGGLLALAMTSGVLLLLPPAAVEHGSHDMGRFCLRITLPLMSMWYLVALAAAGQLNRKIFSSAHPWSERYALYLAIAWLPEACWLVWEIYEGAFR
ncbi:MAG: hypothetical protein AB7U73_06885 [Pirellulales bacterium]